MTSQDVTDLDFHGFIASKQRKRDPTIVSLSRLASVKVSSIVLAINGIVTSDMSRFELASMFHSRNQRLEPTFCHLDQSDLDFHKFEATKLSTEGRTFVSASIGHLVIGTEIIAIDSIPTSTYSPASLKRLFKSRTRRLIPTASPTIVTDLEFHRFEVTKMNDESVAIVSASLLPNLVIGTELYTIDKIVTTTKSATFIKQMFAARDKRLQPIPVRCRVDIKNSYQLTKNIFIIS